MRNTRSKHLFNLGAGFLVLRLVAGPAAQEPRPAACCFAHDGYQGACVVVPGGGETCESILEYLNSANTVGKTYCGGSKLRGGWKAVPCPRPRVNSVAAATRLRRH